MTEPDYFSTSLQMSMNCSRKGCKAFGYFLKRHPLLVGGFENTPLMRHDVTCLFRNVGQLSNLDKERELLKCMFERHYHQPTASWNMENCSTPSEAWDTAVLDIAMELLTKETGIVYSIDQFKYFIRKGGG